jgi:hypothetical protein
VAWEPDFRHDASVADKPGYRISRAVHDRWLVGLNRGTEDSDWCHQQCGSCRHWIPLSGRAGLDWGACTHGQSDFDGQVRFEHDGCPHHEDAGGWRTPAAAAESGSGTKAPRDRHEAS